MWCLARGSSLLRSSFLLLTMEETDGIQFLPNSYERWISFQSMLREYKGVTKQSEDQNINYNSTCRINTTTSWFVDFPHEFLTHSRPPACKNLVLDLYCYRCSSIIISIQLKAWIQSTEINQHISFDLKDFICPKKFDVQVFSILTDGLWLKPQSSFPLFCFAIISFSSKPFL